MSGGIVDFVHEEIFRYDSIGWEDVLGRSRTLPFADGNVRVLSRECHLRAIAIHGRRFRLGALRRKRAPARPVDRLRARSGARTARLPDSAGSRAVRSPAASVARPGRVRNLGSLRGTRSRQALSGPRVSRESRESRLDRCLSLVRSRYRVAPAERNWERQLHALAFIFSVNRLASAVVGRKAVRSVP